MSGPLAGMVWNARIQGLTLSEKALLARIADMCDDEGNSARYRTQRLIAEDLSVSISTVKRGLKKLASIGLITLQRPRHDAHARYAYSIPVHKLANFVHTAAWPVYVKAMMRIDHPKDFERCHHQHTNGSRRPPEGVASALSNNTYNSNNSFRGFGRKISGENEQERKKRNDTIDAELLRRNLLTTWVENGSWPKSEGPSPFEPNWRSKKSDGDTLLLIKQVSEETNGPRISRPFQVRIARALADPDRRNEVLARIETLEQHRL